jgi:diguanylate cyclase (GGDEF)-like protein
MKSSLHKQAAPMEKVDAFDDQADFVFLVDQPNGALDEICNVAAQLLHVQLALILLPTDGGALVVAPDMFRGVILPLGGTLQSTSEEDWRCALIGVSSGAPVCFHAATPLSDEDGAQIGALCVLDAFPREATALARKRLASLASLAANEMCNRLLLHEAERRDLLSIQTARLARIGTWEHNIEARRTMWSEEMRRLFEVPDGAEPPSSEEVFGRVVNEADQIWLRDGLTLLDPRYEDDREIEFRLPSGGTRWIRLRGACERRNGTPVRFYGSMQDITETRTNRLEIERLAYRDSLTGLPNRAYFNIQFQQEIERAKISGAKVGLILLDLDYFKDVNDTLGHDAGDALLCSVAERMRSAYRSSDTIARLGGDEFAIILPDLKKGEELDRLTRTLIELLRSPVEHAGQVFTISASIGGAVYPCDDDQPSQLLKNADIALYEAKSAGRNRFVAFEPTMRANVETRVELLREVRIGLQRGEFSLFYQPVVDIALNAVTGFEALMRWTHPTRGLLSPAAFMAAFEDKDLAPVIGEFTLDSAMRQMRAWLDDGIGFGRVAVNISAAQFRMPDLAPLIEAKLQHWGVPADRLTIEVTENVYMGWGADLVGDTVRRLHKSGVQIALDDFGTGYASLANLKQFPIDRLKIDKSFVQNEQDADIVRAVITLGASLGMKTVAEGVEAPEQLAFLAQAGCNQVQGYHYAKPMPGGDVPAFLARFTG